MKRIKRLLIAVILSLGILPNVVLAASANFSISAPSQGVVGNNITVTVTINSSTSLGSWEMSLQYDKSYLQLSSAPEGANGTHVTDAAKSSTNKSKTYTYKFKVLKSGTTTISTTSTDAYDWNRESLSCTNGSKKITLKTQAEIEASYSSDAYLKSLGVTNYTLIPEFDKKVNEYSLEVENNVDKVTITASKNDSNATVSGAGEKELKEGTNKFEIVVTAQKGNSLTYVVNITRKELNPIEIDAGDKKQFIVRKKADMLTVNSFEETTITYGEEEIPALKNDILNYTLICLKDEEGTIKPFIYKDGKVVEEYIELTNNNLVILPKSLKESQHQLEVVEVVIKGKKINGLAFKKTSRQIVIKGINVVNGEEGIYLYDVDKESFIPFNLDDLSNIDDLTKTINDGKLILIIMAVVILLLIILLIIKKPSKNKKEKVVIDEEIKEDVKEEIKEEPKEDKKEEIFENIEEEVVEKKPKKKKKEKTSVEEIQVEEIKEEQVEEIKIEEIPAEVVQEKTKKAKKNKKKEEVKQKDKNDDEIDDPLNHEDNFVDFWN